MSYIIIIKVKDTIFYFINYSIQISQIHHKSFNQVTLIVLIVLIGLI